MHKLFPSSLVMRLALSGGFLLGYNAPMLDKVALTITLFVVFICALIVLIRVYFGNQPWSL